MKNLLPAFLTFIITFFLNYVLFVPSSPVNLLLSLVKDDLGFYILVDTFLSNIIFFLLFISLRKIFDSRR